MILNLLLAMGISMAGMGNSFNYLEKAPKRQQTLYINLDKYKLNRNEIINSEYDIQIQNYDVGNIDFDDISYSKISSSGQNTSFGEATQISTTSATVYGTIDKVKFDSSFNLVYDKEYFYFVALQWFYLNIQLDSGSANLTCSVYTELHEEICSIPTNGQHVNYLLTLKPGAYYIEIKGTTNNDHGSYTLDFGSNDVDKEEYAETMVINDNIKQNYVGLIWDADYLPGGKTTDQAGEILYSQVQNGLDIKITPKPRSFEPNYRGMAQIFYIWDEEILNELEIMYTGLVNYIQQVQFQFSPSMQTILKNVIDYINDAVLETLGVALSLSTMSYGLSFLSGLINKASYYFTAQKLDSIEDTFMNLSHELRFSEKAGKIFRIRNNVNIRSETYYESSNNYGLHFYLDIIPFTCHDDQYLLENPGFLDTNTISNLVAQDKYNPIDNYGKFTLIQTKADFNQYFQNMSDGIYSMIMNLI